MHFKLSFAFLPFSSHFAVKWEERWEKATTERSLSVFLKNSRKFYEIGCVDLLYAV